MIYWVSIAGQKSYFMITASEQQSKENISKYLITVQLFFKVTNELNSW